MLKAICCVVFVAVFVNTSELGNNCPEIKTRNKWEANAPEIVDYQSFPVSNVIIHHTASPECTTFRSCVTRVKNIQNYHQTSKKWPDIAYNFLIGNDGNIYEGVGWHKIGSHLSGYNNGSIGIAFIGNFNDVLPSQSALQAAKDLIKCGVNSRELSAGYSLFGARQLKKTQSPGLTLYSDIQDWDNWASSPESFQRVSDNES